MTKPNLRELFGRFKDPLSSIYVYDMLEALVEAVEPEDTDATLSKLREELAEAKKRIAHLHKDRRWLKEKRDEAKADIGRLDTECDREALWRKETEQELAKANTTIGVLRRRCNTVCGWKGRCEKGEQALAEAEVVIERLRKERDEWAEKVVAAAGASRLFVVPNQEFEADAEIGRLVRRMQNDTGLGWEDGLYYVLRCHYPEAGHLVWYRQESGAYSTDPAEALRAIQEVKEHKCE